ncbi:MAG: copper chaperone PCu(A)C [Alphaproteobacteria bacterium]|nr:copper chaperone PCu(A)C [Alphaproteobacteria bacterium]
MKRILDCFVVVVAIILPWVAAAEGPEIIVERPWSRASVSKTGAVYLTIVNIGNAADTLIGVSSAAAKKAEVHTTIDDGGVMKMRPVERIEIAPGEHIILEPGGKHIMLIGLTGALQEGGTVPLALMFEKAGPVAATAAVHKAGATMPAGIHGHGEEHLHDAGHMSDDGHMQDHEHQHGHGTTE